MRILRWLTPCLFLVACGAAQTPEAGAANEVDEPEPVADALEGGSGEARQDQGGSGEATQDVVDSGSGEEPDDEVAALEGAGDLASAAPSRSGEGRRRSPPSGGVARGITAGGLPNRRSSMPDLERRAARVVGPAPLEPEVVAAVIEEHLAEVNFCYENVVRDRPDIRGVIVVGATIAPSGQVSDARIRSSTIRNARVDQCVVRTFRRWEFPRAGAPTTVEHPFSLGMYQAR